MKPSEPTSADQAPVPRESAVNRVVAALEAQIFSGELKDGESLPAERSLTEAMGVSRPVAREAIKILGSKGLLEIQPRHRPIVRKPDAHTVMDVLGGLVGHLTGQKAACARSLTCASLWRPGWCAKPPSAPARRI